MRLCSAWLLRAAVAWHCRSAPAAVQLSWDHPVAIERTQRLCIVVVVFDKRSPVLSQAAIKQAQDEGAWRRCVGKRAPSAEAFIRYHTTNTYKSSRAGGTRMRVCVCVCACVCVCVCVCVCQKLGLKCEGMTSAFPFANKSKRGGWEDRGRDKVGTVDALGCVVQQARYRPYQPA